MRRFLSAATLTLCFALPLAAEEAREWHWKSDTTVPGMPGTMASETWIKGDKVRVVSETPMGESTTVIKNKTAYVKTGGMAVKMTVDEGTGPQPADFAKNLDELLKSGTKLGTETLNGEACEKWKVTRPAPNDQKAEMTLWISPSLRFPRKVVVTTERGEVTVVNRDIEKKVTLLDKDFEPEAGVTYEDVTDSVRKMQDQR